MSEKYKIYDGGVFFVTLTIVGWIDLFTRRDYCDIIVNSLSYCIKHKGLKVFAFCIMPSHIHIVAAAENGLLSDILRDMKSYSAKQILQTIQTHPQESRKEWLLYMLAYHAKIIRHNGQYQVWQQHNHPISLHNGQLLKQRINYLHDNPVVAGIVNEAQNYMYSSANPLPMVALEPVGIL